MARVGFDLGASALQCITLNPLFHRGLADNKWFDLNTYSNNPNPNPNPNPYFVYESLICQRQFGGWK